jgi:hypothetical protein
MIHKIRRLTLLSLGLSLGCVTASASASYDPHLWGTFGVGVASNAGHLKKQDNTLTLSNIPWSSKKDLGNFSGTGLFQLGGGMNVNSKFHVGAFFMLPGDSFKTQSIGDAGTQYSDHTVKAKFLAYGGGIRLGYMMDKVLFFTNLGVLSRRFKVTWDHYTTTAGEQNLISEKKGMTAFVPGVGFEYLLTPCVALGMVANVQFYPSKTFESEGTTLQSGLGSFIKFQPRRLSGLLTASYKFNL